MASSPFFGVLCDSSTDSSTIDEEIIAVRFLEKGAPKFDFLVFRPLTRANADCILQTVCASLSEHCPTWKHSLVAFGADGAPVNLGCNTGVATKLRASVPHIVPIHGCAHRLESAIKDAAKQCSLLSSADDIMEHSFKVYHKSPLCWQGLKEKGNDLNLVVLKPTKLKGTRLVAHRKRALKVVLVNWPVLVQHTNDVRQGRTAMQGRATKLYKELTKPGKVIFLYLLYDLLVVLGRLSRTLQTVFSNYWNISPGSFVCTVWFIGTLQRQDYRDTNRGCSHPNRTDHLAPHLGRPQIDRRTCGRPRTVRQWQWGQRRQQQWS